MPSSLRVFALGLAAGLALGWTFPMSGKAQPVSPALLSRKAWTLHIYRNDNAYDPGIVLGADTGVACQALAARYMAAFPQVYNRSNRSRAVCFHPHDGKLFVIHPEEIKP